MTLYYYRRARQPRGEQAARGQGRPREVRRRVAVGARNAGCEEDSRADEGPQVRAALCALLLAFTMACGGDNGGSTSPPPTGGGGSNQDVCAAVRSEAIEPERTAALAPPSSKRGRLDPSPRWRVLDSLWIHQQAADRRAAISSAGPARGLDFGHRRHRGHPRRRRRDRPPQRVRPQGRRPALHPQSVGRLRRPPGRRGVQIRHRQPDHAQRRRHVARRRRVRRFHSSRAASAPRS